MISFSIIIPIYNCEQYVGCCLNSIINQNYQNYEVICVDDKSEDSSCDVVRNFKDSRIRLIELVEHRGVSFARNIGMSCAEKDFVVFVDADDILLGDSLGVLCDAIFNSSVIPDIVSFGYSSNHEVHVSHFPGLHFDILNYLFYGNDYLPYVWNKAFNRQFISENNIKFDTDLSLGEDQLFLFQITPRSHCILVLQDVLYQYRCLREESIMNQFDKIKDKKLDNHIRQIKKIVRTWTLEDNTKTQDCKAHLIRWILDFVYLDIRSMSGEKRRRMGKIVSELINSIGYNRVFYLLPYRYLKQYFRMCFSLWKK